MRYESGYLSRVRGSRGECLAVRYLEMQGMRVLDRNVRVGRDEIDIVVFDPMDHVIAFVEVKMRSNALDYHPSLNMTRKKRHHMVRAARRWVDKNDFRGGYRLDAAYVSGATVEYVMDLDTSV